jgi:hypothetical protein
MFMFLVSACQIVGDTARGWGFGVPGEKLTVKMRMLFYNALVRQVPGLVGVCLPRIGSSIPIASDKASHERDDADKASHQLMTPIRQVMSVPAADKASHQASHELMTCLPPTGRTVVLGIGDDSFLGRARAPGAGLRVKG